MSKVAGTKRVLFNTAIDIAVDGACYPGEPCCHDVILAMRDGKSIPITSVPFIDIKSMFLRLRKPIPPHFDAKNV